MTNRERAQIKRKELKKVRIESGIKPFRKKTRKQIAKEVIPFELED